MGAFVKQTNGALIAALSGRNEDAIRIFDDVSRRQPLALDPFPAWSLLNSPYLNGFRADPRLAEIDERVRTAVNAERKKVSLASISRDDWVSDPQTLLTKN